MNELWEKNKAATKTDLWVFVVLAVLLIVLPLVWNATRDDAPPSEGGTYQVDDYEPSVRN